MQVHALRLEVEDAQTLLGQLKAKLEQLAAAEQAAQQDAGRVRKMLVATSKAVHLESAQDPSSKVPQLPRSGDGAADVFDSLGSLEEDVGAVVSILLQRIATLEQQQTGIQPEAAAPAAPAALAAPAVPEQRAVSVQCASQPLTTTASQATPVAASSGTQTDADAVPCPKAAAAAAEAEGREYGWPDMQQQEVAELTAQLAAARLAEVAARAEQAATNAKLQEAQSKVRVQRSFCCAFHPAPERWLLCYLSAVVDAGKANWQLF